MLKRHDCPISDGMRRNLNAIKEIRDAVEHTLLGRSDRKWLPIFQACCLNFDKALCNLFGDEKSLQAELSYALQFSKIDFDQIVDLNEFDIPPHIQALDARLRVGLTEEQLDDIEYQFKVVYTFVNASKSKSHVRFINPGSEAAERIKNVLLKYKFADDLYPHKPMQVVRFVKKKSGKKFTSNDHVKAWKENKIRPITGSKTPENTNRDYCIYHQAHQDYTYSDAWVEFLVNKQA